MTPIEKLRFRIKETKEYCYLGNREEPTQVVILNQIALMEIMIDEMEVKEISSNVPVSGNEANPKNLQSGEVVLSAESKSMLLWMYRNGYSIERIKEVIDQSRQ